MIIDFPSQEFQSIANFKGGEGHIEAKMYNDDAVRICFSRLEPGNTTGYHKHGRNSEIVYLISGKVRAQYDNEVEYLESGQCHYCPMGHSHGFSNASETETAVMVCVVPEHCLGE